MSLQITIDDLRNVVKSYSSNSAKSDSYSLSQLNAIFSGFNSLFFSSSLDYLSYADDTRKSLRDRTYGRRRQLSKDELSYYDPSNKFIL